MQSLSKKSLLIATFAPRIQGKRLQTNGMVEPLLDYFVSRTDKVVMIEQPYPGSDELTPRIETYRKGKMKAVQSSSVFVSFLNPLLKPFNYDGTHLLFKLRDFLSVFDYSLREKTSFDYFVGLEAVNTLAGIALKKIGKVKRVIYYVSDYSPVRYGDTFFNAVYLWLDRLCVKHADFTWDVSKAIQEGRLKAGLDKNGRYNVIHVPNALYPSQIGTVPVNKRNPYSIVFMGTLDNINGVDLAIDAIKEVKKSFPQTTFHVIGGTKQNLQRLEAYVKKRKLEGSVIFYGFVPKHGDMAKIIRTCSIGLAPYRSYKQSERWYGDAGKIRSYLASGLPVITTHVPPLGREIVEKGAGVMVHDTVKEIKDAIILLFNDKALYKKLAKRAEEISRENTWNNVYTSVLKQMEEIEKNR